MYRAQIDLANGFWFLVPRGRGNRMEWCGGVTQEEKDNKNISCWVKLGVRVCSLDQLQYVDQWATQFLRSVMVHYCSSYLVCLRQFCILVTFNYYNSKTGGPHKFAWLSGLPLSGLPL